MLVIRRLPPQGDDKHPELFVVYSAPDGFDLEQGIHDAGVDFCYGFYKYCGEMADLSNGEFVRLVDNDTCEKYGFSKLLVREEAEDIDPAANCVSVRELKHLFTERDENEKRNAATLEAAKKKNAAIQEARRALAKKVSASERRCNSHFYGWTFEQKMDHVISWAAEFVNSGGTDIDKFYKSKTETK